MIGTSSREVSDSAAGSSQVPAPFNYATLTAGSGKRNDDRVAVFEHGNALVVVVADGAGGMAGGSNAADAVVGAARSAVGDGCDLASATTWTRLMVSLDEELALAFAGETTAIVVVVGPTGIMGASVGDSAAWIVDENTIDELTAGQTKKRIGSGRAAPVAFFRPAFRGVLVAGTDGLFNYASRADIVDATRTGTPAEQAERLCQLVRLPSGGYHDDIGVVVVMQR